jgi:LacI family transcriptional regulator
VGELIATLPAQTRPDALFAANDLVAIGVLQALISSGTLSVPDDIALIGYDDIAFAPSAMVPLTSIRQPSRLMGETALNILNAEVHNSSLSPQQVVFQPELVVRSST